MPAATALSIRAGRAGGAPISRLMEQALANPELISLAAGFVDQQSLPVEPTRQALDALLAEAPLAKSALQYGTTPGHLPLREQLLERTIAADGISGRRNLSVGQMVLTAGSNELLHLIADTLCNPGDIVLCGAPSYFVFLSMLRSVGARAFGIASDAEGMIPEALEAELSRRQTAGELARVKAIYLTTYFDNPGSVTLSAERRRRIVEIAKRWSRETRIYIIEDAAYRELRYEGDDTPSLLAHDPEGDTVIHTQTFSKSYSPGMRVGWGILPPDLVEPVCAQKGNIDFGSPNFAQHLMSTVLELDLFDAHIARLRDSYREKRDAMLEAADEHLAKLPGVQYARPSGGLYVWLAAPPSIDTGPEGALLRRALAEGVLYVPGEYCYAPEGEPAARNRMRLSFGVQSPERIRRGIEALGRAVASLL